ncbi:SMC-Scp complex subunit ScpB [Candidatus Uhrbacteria bacterium]|nr:SMC-Scp complex subunit ScpB [Candidatus Uhrbacteria bacterium]
MNLSSRLEAILFAAAQPLSKKRLMDVTGADAKELESAFKELAERHGKESGIVLVVHGNEYELVTNPDAAEEVRAVLKAEQQGELSRPSLEALAILAYRGPMTRPELEQIRGVQSSMILRNLMLRGLVEMREEQKLGQPVYEVTAEFYKHIGYTSPSELPDYEALRGHSAVVQALQELEPAENPAEGDKPSHAV